MATITLNSQVLNEIPGQIWDCKKKLFNYQVELFSLENFVQGIDSNERDLSGSMNGAIVELRASSDAIEEEIAELEKNQQEIEEFAQFSVEKDTAVSLIVIVSKNDFYDMYSYLKPDCEKSLWEDVCEALDSVVEWCKEYWEELVIVVFITVIIVVAIVVIAVTFEVSIFVILGAAVGGAISGLTTQFGSDLAEFTWNVIFDGEAEWPGTLGDYVGAMYSGGLTGAFGGAFGGAIGAAPGSNLEGIPGGDIGGYILTNCFKNMLGEQDMPVEEMFYNALEETVKAEFYDATFGTVTDLIGNDILKSFVDGYIQGSIETGSEKLWKNITSNGYKIDITPMVFNNGLEFLKEIPSYISIINDFNIIPTNILPINYGFNFAPMSLFTPPITAMKIAPSSFIQGVNPIVFSVFDKNLVDYVKVYWLTMFRSWTS